MKKNFPITTIEQAYPKGQYLVSKTDLKGVITYVNDAFVDISGFSREELIGQSHNIVRHPEMPTQAFEDLWRTVKAGHPWKGLVKNRCKSGDFYWVKAFVVPIQKEGRIVGYMSVRSEPARAEVSATEALYARLNASKGVLNSELPWFRRLRLATRLYGLIGLMFVTLLGGGYIAVQGLQQGNADLRSAYEQHLDPAVAIAKMVERLGDTRAQIMLGLQHDPANHYHDRHDHPVDLHVGETLKNREIIEGLRQAYERSPKSSEEAGLARAFFEARDRLSSEGFAPAREALKAGNYEQVQQLLLGRINPLFKEMVGHADTLQNHLASHGHAAYLTATERAASVSNTIIACVLLAMLLVGASGLLLVRSLTRKLARISTHFGRMAQGDLVDEIDILGRDEAGKVLADLACMQVSLKVMLDEVMAASRAIEAQSRRVEWQSANVADQSEQQREKAVGVAAATEQFSQSVSGVSESANETASSADAAQVQVAEAQSLMERSMDATGRVVEAVQSSSATILELDRAIAKIGDITNIIREIADQTNLLALNAAIEAARAGESGRGFAVVADEVRKLAERTALSTRDISSNVSEIRLVTDTAVASMSEAVREVEAGITLIRESGQGLSQITRSSEQVTGMARDIASAAQEQVVASQLVAQNMERIVELVECNVSAAGEAKIAVDNLVQMASYLNRIVGRFRLTE